MFNKIFGESKGILNIVTLMELILSFLSLLFGLFLLANQGLSLITVSIITGILIILFGIADIYSFIKRKDIILYSMNIFIGIVTVILGILAFFLNNYLTYIIGIFFIVKGIQKIIYGIYLKKYNESSWLFILVTGILFIILGIVTFFTVLDATFKVTIIDLIGFSLMNVIFIILLRRRSKYFIAE